MIVNKITEKIIKEILNNDWPISDFIKDIDSNDNTIKKILDCFNDPKAEIPNSISLSRLPLGLLIPFLAYKTKNEKIVLSASLIYALSDFLDGYWAKKISKHPTEGGKYIDAACDKIGAVELIIPAIIQNPLLLINGSLETIIAKINSDAIKEGKNVDSTMLGKVKMWPLSITILSTYMGMTNTKLSKNFKKASIALIPVTAALEIMNIMEYKKMADDQKTLKKQRK